MTTRRCYTWGLDPIAAPVLWKNANWLWSECLLVDEIISGVPSGGVDASKLLPEWLREEEKYPHTPENKEKRRRFIKLLCKIKGEPDYESSKEIKTDIKITIDDVKLVVKTVRGLDLIIKD